MKEDKVGESGHMERFNGRAEDYAKNRPKYPHALIHALEVGAQFSMDKVVADIGSGTGILSELFLENGNLVYCVEPNKDMRKVAEKYLRRYALRFVSIDGRAESTNLKSESVDLATVGQALHWFDLERTRAEFARIVRSGGHVAVVYNYRREKGSVEEAYAELTRRYDKDRAAVPDVKDAYIARFFGRDGFRKYVMPNSQTLDLEGLLGRLASASYMPPRESEEWAKIEEDASRTIREHGSGGTLVLHYDTTMYLGRISQA